MYRNSHQVKKKTIEKLLIRYPYKYNNDIMLNKKYDLWYKIILKQPS